MRVNTKQRNKDKCYLSLTFENENEERAFLQKLVKYWKEFLPINCMITDLDSGYSLYEQYFPRGNYYIFENVSPSVSIFAFELNNAEVQDVIANWGYYTFDAILSMGSVKPELIDKKKSSVEQLMSMPVVVRQVLDTSLDIYCEYELFEKMSRLLFQE